MHFNQWQLIKEKEKTNVKSTHSLVMKKKNTKQSMTIKINEKK